MLPSEKSISPGRFPDDKFGSRADLIPDRHVSYSGERGLPSENGPYTVFSGHLLDFPRSWGSGISPSRNDYAIEENSTRAELSLVNPVEESMRSDPDRPSAYSVRSTSAGCLVIDSRGKIAWRGELSRLPGAYQDHRRIDYGNKWILPGFVDAHIHFPQYRMLASHGANLLDWLTKFTFPEEMAFESEQVAEAAATTFLNHLFRAGTTSCLCFATSHVVSVQAIFRAAADRNMALITGKTMMDRGAPDALLDLSSGYIADCRSLIGEWHGRKRLRYAISPRFAITSSDSQLQLCGQLASDFPSIIIQTHLSESLAEIEAVKRLFPWAKNYTEVYHRFGLVREGSLFAHGIHLSEEEKSLLAARGAGVVHCPTSNTFLGSGLFPWQVNQRKHAMRIGLGSDIGAGTSYSMLQNMKEAYSISQLVGGQLQVAELFGTATLGNAQLLGIDEEVGTLDVGKFADFIVINPHATELLRDRSPLSHDVTDQLFALLILGDDRVVEETYVAGMPRKNCVSAMVEQ